MSPFKLSKRSRGSMRGVHPDLVQVVELAITRSPFDFTVTQGLRTLAEQARLVAGGRSQTMKSRHLTGHAVDVVVLVDGQVTWDFSYYAAVAQAFKSAAAELGKPIVWGGDWKSFKDGPHFELDRKAYP